MPPSDTEPRYRLVDSNGNVVASLFVNANGNVEIQDETATGTVFGPNGIVTPAINAGSVTTDELNTEYWIDPGVSDVGQAVIDIITAQAPGQVVIHLPPATRLTQSTKVDIRPGNYNLQTDTSVTIKGWGANRESSSSKGTQIDASGVTDDAWVVDNMKDVTLEGFQVDGAPGTGVVFGDPATSDPLSRDCALRDIVTANCAIGFETRLPLGAEIAKLHSDNCGQGFIADGLQTVMAENITVRRTTSDTDPAIVIKNSDGGGIQYYVESCDGPALAIWDSTAFTVLDGYHEANGDGGTSLNREVVVGDSSNSTRTSQGISFINTRFATPAQTFGAERITVDDADGVTFIGCTGSMNGAFNLFGTANAGFVDCVNCDLTDVDLSSATKAGRFEGTNITGTAAYQTERFPQEVSASRSLGTWEQNTTGRPLEVSVVVELNSDGELRSRLSVNDSQSYNPVSRVRLSGQTTASRGTVSATVPAGEYYEVDDPNSNLSITSWNEGVANY